jgi:DNA-binding PadR family transcriptional regulator
MYPLLEGLEREGYLESTEQRNGKSLRLSVSSDAARSEIAGSIEE